MRFSPTASRHTETRFTLWFASISTALWMATAVSAATSHFEYISPVPGSSMVSPGNNVVIREGHHIDRNSLHEDSSVLVVGSVSGPHPGHLLLADDSKTLIFNPDMPFACGEEVTVRLAPGVRTLEHADVAPLNFKFTTMTVSPERYAELSRRVRRDEFGPHPAPSAPAPNSSRSKSAPARPAGSLPADYPSITLLRSDNPDPGNVFISPFSTARTGRLIILDNYGMPIFYRSDPETMFDFKMQNGLLTYEVYFNAFVLDSTYAKVDSFQTGNGYRVDVHDFQLFPNGHSLLTAYDPQPVRMDLIVPGGNPNAIVTGLIVQELDASRNVIFQWRSWDHFQITDGSVSGLVSMTDSLIDYVHGNAVELDQDGNLLISCRHMNEITKINRSTGNIIWRLGPRALNNQFTFVGDPRGFSHQHDIRRLPNGHITLFDNGNFVAPTLSRALEYKLNETGHVATLVWKYQEKSAVFGGFMGNVQRHASGGTESGGAGTMISWGGTPVSPHVTEIHADGTKAYELAFEPSWWTYRAFRFPWRTNLMVTSRQSLDFGRVVVGGTRTLPLSVKNNSASPLTITDLATTDSTFSSPTSVPFTIPAGQSAPLMVAFSPASSGQFVANLYLRSVRPTELIAQVVALSGSADVTSATGGGEQARTMLHTLFAPEGGPVEIRFGIGESRAPVSLAIFDARGHRIRLLDQSVRDPGEYVLHWDRCDDRGRRVSRGVYFVQLSASNYRETKKLALLR